MQIYGQASIFTAHIAMLNFHVLTLFPEFFASPLGVSLMGRAISAGIISVDLVNPRDFSADRHRHVDDKAYGGGPGMVMRPEPLCAALRSLPAPGRILLMSPSGRQFDQQYARELAKEENITLVCGRYEGIDARIGEIFPVEEVCLCPAVLNGGEAPAFAIMEAVGRLAHGFLGKDESASEESFANGLLEYPQYTRPEVFEGREVPSILLSGDHGRIASWRREKSLEKTLANRTGMLGKARLDKKDAEALRAVPRERYGRMLSFCLFHYPVYLDKRTIGASSLTNLDIHDIGRISRSYGMSDFYVLTPLRDQLELLRKLLWHWTGGPGAEKNPDRSRALGLVRPVSDIETLVKAVEKRHGRRPVFLASSANWPEKRKALVPGDARKLCEAGPVVICLGTARGLALKAMDFCGAQLAPLCFLGDNHLSVRSAAAILADRILGDYY